MEAGEAVEGSQAQHTQQLAPQEALLGGELQGGTIENKTKVICADLLDFDCD